MKVAKPKRKQDFQLHVEYLDKKQGWKLLDANARKYLGMSAEEFLSRWDCGEFTDIDTPEMMNVAFLIPFVRQNTARG